MRVLVAFALAVAMALPSMAMAQRPGKPAPEFALEVMQGDGPGSLAELRGRVVVIEFWATYCGWCRGTHPWLAKLQKEEPSVAVVGINWQNKKRLTRWLKKHDLGFTVVHDKGARVARRYRAKSTPTLAVINQKGTLVYWGQGQPAARKAIKLARALAAKERGR